jgi:hypothetical protein
MTIRSYRRVDALRMQFGELEQSPARAQRKDLEITYNGNTYEYGGYRYEIYADAVTDARMHRLLAFSAKRSGA